MNPSENQVEVEVLISEKKIRARVAEMAEQLNRDYQGREVTVIGILKGAWVFMADLVRHLTVPIRADFMIVTSYGCGTETSGDVKIVTDLSESIEGKDVLIVEDIVDTGLTLQQLLEVLKTRHPRTLRICAFLDKKERRKVDVSLDYIGFQIPDKFVVGYGLDWDGKFRHLPHVGVINLP